MVVSLVAQEAREHPSLRLTRRDEEEIQAQFGVLVYPVLLPITRAVSSLRRPAQRARRRYFGYDAPLSTQ